MIERFAEAETVTASLAESRRQGIPFGRAWRQAIETARRGRLADNPRWADAKAGLAFARKAYERAYTGQERTRQDVVAGALADAMELLYDWSEDAGRREYEELMEAA